MDQQILDELKKLNKTATAIETGLADVLEDLVDVRARMELIEQALQTRGRGSKKRPERGGAQESSE